MPIDYSKRIIIAQLGAPFGIKGWLKVRLFCSNINDFMSYNYWQYNEDKTNLWQDIVFDEFLIRNKSVIIHISNCNDREIARKYVNAEISVFRNQLPKLNDNDCYWVDLEGFTVYNLDQIKIGIIETIRDIKIYGLLVIKTDKGLEKLVPYIDEFVKKIDFDSETILVDWPENI